MNTGLLSVTLLVLFSLSVAAQDAEPGHGTQTLHTGTQLVILDATVYDKQHQIVMTPLTSDDFQVTENNTPQDIRYFESQADHQAAAAKGEAPLTIAILDEVSFPYNPAVTNADNIQQQVNDYTYVRNELLHWLQQQPAQLAGPMEVLALTHHGYVIVAQAMRSRDLLVDSVSHRDPGLGSPYRDYLEETGGSSGASADHTSTKISLQALWGLGVQERSEPGRKIVLWMGWGGPNVSTQSEPRRGSLLTPFDITVRRIRNLLVDARITLDVFTPGVLGEGDPKPGKSEEGNRDIALQRNVVAYSGDLGFSGYVKLTGGRIYTGNDVTGEVASTSNASTRFYTLSYTPKTRIDDASFRSVQVRVKGHPDWTVVTKAGYYAFGVRNQRDQEKEVLNDMAVATYEPMPFSAIDLRLVNVQRLPTSVGDKSPPLARFTLQADSTDLQWRTDTSTGARQADINLSAAALRSRPEVLASRVGEWKLSAHAAEGEHIRTQVAIIVPVPAKAARVRFVMRDAANGRLGTLEVRSAVLDNAPLYVPPVPDLQGHSAAAASTATP
jgi:VWFA-related protein